MKNILIINGHQRYPFNEGRLNQTLTDTFISELHKKYVLKTSIIEAGYDIKEEQAKFMWADCIIFQTPVYWFSAPALLKKYMEDVYEYGVFYKGADGYGNGGLLKGKQYMLSTTWNAGADAFSGKDPFFGKLTTDDVFVAFHKTQAFTGMTPLPSYACYDVVKNPDIDKCLTGLKKHIKDVFNT